MDYEETLLLLDSIVGTFAVVYPVGDDQDDLTRFAGALWTAGRFKRDLVGESKGAQVRRGLYAEFPDLQQLRPDLSIGDAPLEAYERQVAHYTFEDMDDQWGRTGFAGFSLWRHDFVGSRWLELPVRPDWLHVTTESGALVVVADFPGAPRGGASAD